MCPCRDVQTELPGIFVALCTYFDDELKFTEIKRICLESQGIDVHSLHLSLHVEVNHILDRIAST